MKGYSTGNGYMGYVDGEYMLFANESEYREYLEDQEYKQAKQNVSSVFSINMQYNRTSNVERGQSQRLNQENAEVEQKGYKNDKNNM